MSTDSTSHKNYNSEILKAAIEAKLPRRSLPALINPTASAVVEVCVVTTISFLQTCRHCTFKLPEDVDDQQQSAPTLENLFPGALSGA